MHVPYVLMTFLMHIPQDFPYALSSYTFPMYFAHDFPCAPSSCTLIMTFLMNFPYALSTVRPGSAFMIAAAASLPCCAAETTIASP